MRLLSNSVIYHDGRHNAFTSMVRWNDKYWVAFRNWTWKKFVSKRLTLQERTKQSVDRRSMDKLPLSHFEIKHTGNLHGTLSINHAADLSRFLVFMMIFCFSRRLTDTPFARPGDLPRGLGKEGGGSICRIIRPKSRCTREGEASVV